ncbi:ROK family transcriptional regulator [Nocardioides sp.]|uniref:ROK family transcriptional regulator n=1 Tax=Nocardioides sp. TaxID=35761 RepID=UPI002ED7D739
MREPGTPRLLRAINDRSVLDLLLAHGPLSRPALGELTGLSKPTMSQILARLESAHLVRRGGSTAGRPGPNALLYEVDPTAAYVAGLDVTARRIRAAVADITGEVVGTFELPTPGRAAEDTVERVGRAVDGACAAAGVTRADLTTLVVGTPGAFDPRTQRLRYARHLPGWHGPELLSALADALGTTVVVENDVNLAAIAELNAGAARGGDDFVLLWAEEGVGAAIVLDGRLHRGVTGGAGEVGFLPVPGTPLVRNVGVSNAGGFQELVGAKAVQALARQHGFKAPDARAGVAAAVASPGGEAFLAELGHRLAVGLAAVVALLDPALVVLSGAVVGAGGERLRAVVQRELDDLAATRPRLELAEVTTDPVLTGALHAALRTARDLVFDTTADRHGRPARTTQTGETG